MIKIIVKWDLFKYGEEFYEMEVVDVVQVVYDEDDFDVLVKSIQYIFEVFFE